MVISELNDVEEIETLRSVSSRLDGFFYQYDDDTIALLRKNFFLADSLYLKAEKNGEFAGFCSVDRDWWEEGYFFIREIIVSPKFQKQGVGAELMSKCIAHARSKGAIGVVTETDFGNGPMQNLCAKLHFQKWDNPQWREGVTFKLEF